MHPLQPHAIGAKLISPKKLTHLLAWKHSGFSIHHGGEQPVPGHDAAGRKRLAEYLLRHPFSLQKITWNPTTKTVIYRSKRHHTTKRNFEIFKAPDFIAAALLHLPPKGQQTVRYYGLYSNKTRGQTSPIPNRIIRPSESESDPFDQLVRRSLGEGVSSAWQPKEISLGDGRTLVLEDS